VGKGERLPPFKERSAIGGTTPASAPDQTRGETTPPRKSASVEGISNRTKHRRGLSERRERNIDNC
jgi:hypothetical protein